MPEHHDDPIALFIATRGLRTLKLIALLIAVALVVTGVLHYRAHGNLLRTPFLPFLLVLALIGWLLHREQLRPAFLVLLWGMCLLALYAGFTVAGMQSPALLLLPVVGMMGGWLLGHRHAATMLIVSSGGLLAIGYLQERGLLPSEPRDPSAWVTIYIFLTMVTTLVGVALATGVREQYRRALALGDELVRVNQGLEQTVERRTREVREALDNLRRTQDDLIQAEKLAALGGMVAGIAHELNTPIGNALTVSSTMQAQVQNLRAQMNDGSLKRSGLADGLAVLDEMAALTVRSTERAATLIASFKQVAVDQVSERRRTFDLHDVVEENLNTLRPGLRQAPWIIENRVPRGLQCDSYPGPLGQVLSNLIQNAIVHGFAGRNTGRIEISATVDDGQLSLSVADDGVGMDTATTMRIFEPFFTTALGRGGSGLGLAVCHRIVSTILAGDIHVRSSPGTGTQFVIRMPLRTPGAI